MKNKSEKEIFIRGVININLINNYIKTNNLSKTKFCKICNISLYTFNKIITERDFAVIELFKIADVIKVPVYDLFNLTYLCDN